MSESLWDWSLQAWRTPGVEEAALELQDTAGQNVCLLLWSAWSVRVGAPLDDETLEAACDVARAWEGRVTGPLRGVRRALKGQIIDIETADREAVRDAVKAVELDAERRLLRMLEGMTLPERGPSRPYLDGLLAASRVWDRMTPRAALTAFAERLPA